MKTLDIKPKPYFLVTWEKIDAWAYHQKLDSIAVPLFTNSINSWDVGPCLSKTTSDIPSHVLRNIYLKL